MKTDWIAVFKSDYTSKVFFEAVPSNDVLFWIKRYENGLTHTATSTGNIMRLRNFEFYTKDLEPTILSYDGKNSWSCSEILEKIKDRLGSRCIIKLSDPLGDIKEIRMSGWYSRQGWNPSIDEDLYFTALIVFLKDMSTYESWANLAKINPSLYTDIVEHNGVPQIIFEEIERRNNAIRQIQQARIIK
jgi:hypothetical protein